MKWGPTSMNGCPLRILFLRTKESKERLRPALAPGNVPKTMSAPVTAILANDMKFYDKLPKLMPHNPKAASFFETSPEVAEVTARRNATLQGPTSCSRLAHSAWTAARCQGSISLALTRSFSAPGWSVKVCARNTRPDG